MVKATPAGKWWRWRALLVFVAGVVVLQVASKLASHHLVRMDTTSLAVVLLGLGLVGAGAFILLWSRSIVRGASVTNPNQGPWIGRLEFAVRWVLAHLLPRPQAESWFRWGLRAPYRDQALAYLARAARGHHADAHFELGLYQEHGEWGRGGRQAAARHYLAAAQLGHGEAAFRLAEALRWGTGPTQEPEAAMRWYLHSAKLGFGPAMGWLAHAYATGDGCAVEAGKAAFWQAQLEAQPIGTGLRQSALVGVQATEDHLLARMGQGVREGVDDSAQALLETPGFATAARGLTHLAFVLAPLAVVVFLALQLRFGGVIGGIFAIPAFVSLAGLTWLHFRQRRGMQGSLKGRRLEAAARKGEPEACYRLGLTLLRGDHDHPEDTVAARQWLQRAAHAGHVGAMAELGEVLSWGVGGLQDRKAGIAWLERAAAEGHAGARSRLERAPAADNPPEG